MRRIILAITTIAAFGAIELAAQQPHPPANVDELLSPHGPHARPAPANPPHTPEILFDASSLGSPLVLDKGWRIGITASPAPAEPGFDDSTWAIRDAQGTFADVPDLDRPADAPDGADKSGPPGKSGFPSGHQRPFAWYRMHIKLAPGHGPIYLLIELPTRQNTSMDPSTHALGLDVFANGKPIDPEGPNPEDPEKYEQISRIYSLNVAPAETSLTLVVRTTCYSTGMAAYTNFFVTRIVRLGYQDDLRRTLELWSVHSLFERLPRLVNGILLVVLALFLLALFFSQKGHIEYLWLALYELAQAPIAYVELAGTSARLDTFWYGGIMLELVLTSAFLYFVFLNSFLSLPRRWYIRAMFFTAPVMLMAGPMVLQLGHNTAFGNAVAITFLCILIGMLGWPLFLLFRFLDRLLRRKRWYILAAVLYICSATIVYETIRFFVTGHFPTAMTVFVVAILGSILWILGWFLFILITLITATIRRNFEAGLLLVPLLLTLVGIIEPLFTGGMMDSLGGAKYHSPLTLQAGPIPIHFAVFADSTGVFVIVLIIFVRFIRVQRDQERTSSELAAARSVQELMIPHEKLETPGYEVDSIYNPANEVGGDFYHVQPTSDGGMLVIIGDVAGKGLKAAMNVSMLMGALRRTTERSPARILESLNRVLTGSESFTTCQAAWFGANGELILANAGHLPPYLNTQEVALPGGLPLGVLADITYPEVRLYLHPGDRILLLSDGVVEARRASGELFGFDRVHNLSNQTAFYIADAAREFGQEDDITVLTVRRLAEAMAA